MSIRPTTALTNGGLTSRHTLPVRGGRRCRCCCSSGRSECHRRTGAKSPEVVRNEGASRRDADSRFRMGYILHRCRSRNVDSVRKGIDAFNRRDFDTALELLSDDVAFERFLSRTESQTEGIRGRRELRAVWESQVEAVDLRVEPEEFVAVGAYKVIVPVRMIARGTGSEIRLEASIAWLCTFDEAGTATRVEVFESRDKALTAAVGLGE